MKAVVFQGVGEPLTVEDVEPPTAGPDGVVVETEACGICRSDWHAWQGDWSWIGIRPTEGCIFGHEPTGVVREVGEEVERFSEGDRVTVPFNLSDGTCRFCRRGESNRCENAVPLGFLDAAPGAFAERFPVSDADQNLVHLPDGVDPVDAAGLGCRFATAFHGLVHRVDVTPGDWVAVHGCGGVGLSAIHIADALGANVVAVDIDDRKLDRARELGADETVNAEDVRHVPQAVKRATPNNRGTEISVDALGIAETCRNAVDSLGKGGQHLQLGLTTDESEGEVSLPIDVMTVQEREFYGSLGMPHHEYEEIFQMIRQGTIDPSEIVSEEVALGEVPAKIEALGDYETVGIPVVTDFR
jgi:alcohol dehydrogenase